MEHEIDFWLRQEDDPDQALEARAERMEEERQEQLLNNHFNQMNTKVELQALERENKELKQQKAESIRVLKGVLPEVGLHWGSEVSKHLAQLNGHRFNEKDFDMSDRNGEQDK